MAIRSLGKVLVAVAGTPVQATSNLDGPTNRVATQSILFQVLPANAGIVYVGLKNMVKATLAGVFTALPKPVSQTTGPFTSASFSVPMEPSGLNAADFWIDADNNADGVLVTITNG